MSKGSPENLKAPRTTEEARERGKKGGIASGKARREKKMMSRILADFLQKKHKIKLEDGSTAEIDTPALLTKAMVKVLSRGDSSSVQLIKAITDILEGTRHMHEITGAEGTPLIPSQLEGLTAKERRDMAKMLAKARDD